jgi:hypothetical protein
MIIHRISIPLQDLINRVILGAKKANSSFDYEVDAIKIDSVSRQLIVDIRQTAIKDKDVCSQKQT